jgi:hypothetical protein
MQRQEEGEADAGDAVHDEGPIGRVVAHGGAASKGQAAHVTAATARRPRTRSRSPKTAMATSSPRPRQAGLGQHGAQADRAVDGGRHHEEAVEAGPEEAALGAAEDGLGAEAGWVA